MMLGYGLVRLHPAPRLIFTGLALLKITFSLGKIGTDDWRLVPLIPLVLIVPQCWTRNVNAIFSRKYRSVVLPATQDIQPRYATHTAAWVAGLFILGILFDRYVSPLFAA